jgi:hypothetical protein
MKHSKRQLGIVFSLIVSFVTVSVPMFAHHGSAISYDMTKPWTTKAMVTEWRYINPHPLLFFDITEKDGTVAHWHSELITQPSWMLRNGWTRRRTEEALKPGTIVTLTLCTARVGGNSAVVTRILDEKGGEVVTGNAAVGGGR